ncbi:hypothetical protein [Amycolatopsis sp. NPDC059021]|uniref:hypothetical protein n=1 Tax=Amycolatopsis sp. NPDC059021 TaxID=3346704 RepID=UPI00366E139D
MASLLAAIFTISTPLSAHAESGDQYCIITVTKEAPGSPEAKVIDNSCGPTREAAAAKRPAMRRNVLLAELFQHTNQNSGVGGWRADLVADSECDSAGWGFSNIVRYNDAVGGISSYRTFAQCNGSAIYSEKNFKNLCGIYSFQWDVNVPWSCNDHVYSMKLYKSY